MSTNVLSLNHKNLHQDQNVGGPGFEIVTLEVSYTDLKSSAVFFSPSWQIPGQYLKQATAT